MPKLLMHGARRVVIFSRDEQKQEQLERDMDGDERLRFFLGDVRDQPRLELAMRGCSIVIHAAALKIIPKCEKDPEECIKTNLIGAMNVAQAALMVGVSRVIALSTDKACNPINLYGAAKLCAEKHLIAFNDISIGHPMISVVRYGNVAGSRGSVIPFFIQLANQGISLPITDPRMTRFHMTLEEATEFVLSSLVTMQGGEIFVPKLPSFRITDLAAAVSPGYPVRFVGIRPGEKIHETLLVEDEGRYAEDAGDIYIVRRTPSSSPVVGPYSSGTNDRWLTVSDLGALVASHGYRPDDRRVA